MSYSVYQCEEIQFTVITTPSWEGNVLAEPETIHGDIDFSFIPHPDVLNFISTFGNKNILFRNVSAELIIQRGICNTECYWKKFLVCPFLLSVHGENCGNTTQKQLLLINYREPHFISLLWHHLSFFTTNLMWVWNGSQLLKFCIPHPPVLSHLSHSLMLLHVMHHTTLAPVKLAVETFPRRWVIPRELGLWTSRINSCSATPEGPLLCLVWGNCTNAWGAGGGSSAEPSSLHSSPGKINKVNNGNIYSAFSCLKGRVQVCEGRPPRTWGRARPCPRSCPAEGDRIPAFGNNRGSASQGTLNPSGSAGTRDSPAAASQVSSHAQELRFINWKCRSSA